MGGGGPLRGCWAGCCGSRARCICTAVMVEPDTACAIHAKNKSVGRIIPFLVLGFGDKYTMACAGAMPFRRDYLTTTRILNFQAKNGMILPPCNFILSVVVNTSDTRSNTSDSRKLQSGLYLLCFSKTWYCTLSSTWATRR